MPHGPPNVVVMIEIQGLTRRFGDLTAVDDVSFAVHDGHMTGFVGGNGAGKTTTMRMTMGLLGIDAGRVLWNGAPITAANRQRTGYMPEERGLYPKQKIVDQLVYLGELSGMSASDAKAAIMDHLERFGLADRANDRVEKLSLGNQQRVQIIAALMTRTRRPGSRSSSTTSSTRGRPKSGIGSPIAADSPSTTTRYSPGSFTIGTDSGWPVRVACTGKKR